MNIITRFSPSPTGLLHIGGFRTAVLNWAYAKKNNGKFLLRIEDTDVARNKEEFSKDIIESLNWASIFPDEVFLQSKNLTKHIKIAENLVEKGLAYYCICEDKESDSVVLSHKKYDGKCRNNKEKIQNAAIRINTSKFDLIVVRDLLKGDIKFGKENIDDIVIVRKTGIPTYHFACVVDDIEMSITHVIRGDEHLVNTVNQIILYEYLESKKPVFIHVPLLHNNEGKKLSKRDGALGVLEYKKIGILPIALKNYCLLLGSTISKEFVKNDEEIFRYFNIDKSSKSPARFDLEKLMQINFLHINAMEEVELVEIIKSLFLKKKNLLLSENQIKRISKGISGLKERSKLLNDLMNLSECYTKEIPIEKTHDALTILNESDYNTMIELLNIFDKEDTWSLDSLKILLKDFIKNFNLKPREILMPLRACLAGEIQNLPVHEMLYAIGKEESLKRIRDYFE